MFCLGFDRAEFEANLSSGDHASVSQTADFGDTKVLRVRARLRCSTAHFLRWTFKVLVDGTVRASRALRAGREWDPTDISLGVADLAAGDHLLELRLEAES